MGTVRNKNNKKVEVAEIQEEIERWLNKINLSQREFAKRYYYTNKKSEDLWENDEIDKEIKQFQEKVKKQLSRSTTKLELLEEYRKFLYSQDEIKNLGYVYTDNYTGKEISTEFDRRMRNISHQITDIVINQDK